MPHLGHTAVLVVVMGGSVAAVVVDVWPANKMVLEQDAMYQLGLGLHIYLHIQSPMSLPSHVSMPSPQVWSKLESPALPHFPNQEPPRAQQLRLPDFLTAPHLGHTAVLVAVMDGSAAAVAVVMGGVVAAGVVVMGGGVVIAGIHV